MDQFRNKVKTNIRNFYNNKLKGQVDKSVEIIERNGCGRFLLNSTKTFSIWLLTCIVYCYSKLEIAYEMSSNMGKVNKYINDINTPGEQSNTTRILKFWTDESYINDLGTGIDLITMQETIKTIKEINLLDENVKLYSMITDGKLMGILINNPNDHDNDFKNKFKLKKNNQYLSAIKKSRSSLNMVDIDASASGSGASGAGACDASACDAGVSSVCDAGTDCACYAGAASACDEDITDLINMYANVITNGSIDVDDIRNLNGNLICSSKTDVIQLINKDVVTSEVTLGDKIIF